MQQTLFSSAELGWEWIDVENPTMEELQLLAERFGLHPASVRDCMQPEHLPKYEIANDVVFIIARIYDAKAHREADTIQELTNKVSIFYHEKFIITIHKHPAPYIAELIEKYIDNQLVKTTAG